MSEDPNLTDEDNKVTEPGEASAQQSEAEVQPLPDGEGSNMEAEQEQSPAVEAPEAEPVGSETASETEPHTKQKAAIPGADLEVDIVQEGDDPFGEESGKEQNESLVSEYFDETLIADEIGESLEGEEAAEPVADSDEDAISKVVISLADGARYRATGKRKTAVARVTLKPGTGVITVNNRPVEEYFPRPALRKVLIQPLETIGHVEKLDVDARIHGSGLASQAGALRHGIARALLEADPNARIELKRRGFLTRDARVKERRKAGLKKARKRPQFSKR